MLLQPGDILLDKYRIEALLGQGAFAKVYRVTHLGLNVPRALKVLRRSTPGVGSTEFEEFTNRFQFEAQIGAKLGTPAAHPNLLQVHNFEVKGEQLVLEMEYASGGSLAERIKKYKDGGAKFPLEEAVQIALDIAEGLAVIHDQDIIHRDLKPNNILFDHQGRAKVADLGLAQVPGGQSMRSKLSNPQPHPGTPGYMSPEQEHEQGYLRPPSDIYSLGIVLFEMLTSRNYTNLEPGTRAISMRADVPIWLDDLLAGMLAEEPKQRPWDGKKTALLLRVGLQEAGEKKKRDAAKGLHKREQEERARRNAELWIRIFWKWKYLLLIPVLGILIYFITNSPQKIETPAVTFPSITPGVTASSEPNIIQTRTFIPTSAPLPTSTITIIPTSSLGIDSTMTGEDGMTLLYVPGGEFRMGSEANSDSEMPVHPVYLDAYWIDKTEVTNKQYTGCVSGGGCTPPSNNNSNTHTSYFGNNQFDDYPVIYVNWEQAQAYCEWAGRRLPTEAEWEKAARGTDERTYPWGETEPEPGSKLLNFNIYEGDTTPVGKYLDGASPYGALDMAGNVWEWVNDWYDIAYYQNSPGSNPMGPGSGNSRVARGGSWYDNQYIVTSSFRDSGAPSYTDYNVGFRCARGTSP